MNNQKVLRVEAQDDHLNRVAGNDPLLGLDEVIWNSLDADADRVEIDIVRGPLDSIEKIVIRDNGVGFSLEEAQRAFTSLGGSQKFGQTRTANGRMLHGQKGEGRYRALALGSLLLWRSTFQGEDGLSEFEIQLEVGSLSSPVLTELPEPTRPATGCVVEVKNVTDRAELGLTTDLLWVIASRFASYLLANPSVRIYVENKTVDVNAAVESLKEENISFEHRGAEINATLTAYFWNSGRLNELFLCRSDGVAVEQVKHVVDEPSLSYSAYVSSPYFDGEGDQPYSDMGRMDEVAEEIRKRGRRHLKSLVRQKLAERAKKTISDLEKRGAYPYEGSPTTEIEKAEREVFDIVASRIYELSPSAHHLKTEDLRDKFSIVKEAIGEGPTLLNKLLSKLFKLDEENLRDLDALTDRHGFQRLISLAKQAEHRLEFLHALHFIVYDPDTRTRVLERRQLHKIIEKECWIFGEQYRLLVSDQDLWTVLESHRQYLGREELISSDPIHEDINMDEVPDLFLAGSIPGTREGAVEHLVVELKRPTVKVGLAEVTQIENYADAVANHGGFDTTDTKWRFIVISGEIHEKVTRTRLSNPNTPANQLAATDTYEILVYPWSKIIQIAKSRMSFVRQSLQYDVSKQRIKEHLKENHSDVLELNRSAPTLGDMLRNDS